MFAEILATGDEIRSGALIDSNSAYIAVKLEEIGIPVTRHSCVGDDFEALVSILKEISTRVDICVVTGGLGPTADDLSSEAAASAAGEALVLDSKALSDIEAFFRDRKREMADSNRKQAMLPRTAEAMYNPVGTAPGFSQKIGKCVFFFLPGVPPEMKHMLSHEVLPRIEKMPGALKEHCLVRNISTFGLTESAAGEKVADLVNDFPGIKLGLRAKFPEIHIKLYLNGQDLPAMETKLASASEWILNRLGHYVLSSGRCLHAGGGGGSSEKKGRDCCSCRKLHRGSDRQLADRCAREFGLFPFFRCNLFQPCQSQGLGGFL